MITSRLAAIAAALVSSSVLASPADFTFRSVADSTNGYTFLNHAAINNNGTVVFSGGLADGTSGIYTGPDPSTDVFADNTGDAGFAEIGRPVINDAGVIVFFATERQSSRQGIFNGGNPFNAVVPPGSYTGVKDPVINNAGKVAFWGVYGDNVQGIFTGPNPATDTVADTSVYPTFNDLVGPRIMNDGTVAFIASGPAPDFTTGIFTGPDRVGDVIVDTSGLIGGIKTFDINDSGDIIAAVQLDDETPALLVGTDPATDAISLADFGFAGEHVAINNAGDVAFDGTLADNRLGIFTGPDGEADRVIGAGDALFGSTLRDLFFLPDGFNDKGEVAFAYRLSNDRFGIAVATPRDGTVPPPTPIPLPGAIPATLVCLAPFAARSTWKRWHASMRP
ncbi:MAG TPA: choice-of-anchor tandem repeat NxxGxxAF-containing protein [Tepidisphaeraceae bacterium]|nr:choice-of-anchor tandem repeat NxxGxxAF-containing protein [Tepidisphaeraceae bacterium]